MTLQLRPAVADDLAVAIKLLRNAGLPTEDLTADRLALVAECDGEVYGLIGVEVFDGVALLRSLIIAEHARGSGVGSYLVAALESECAEASVTEMWLLTIDADEYFERQGYQRCERDEAPDTIRGTAEFSGLCPDDAILMCKSLT